ncbi:MAG: serine acetyltransferase [Spirochaetales bacterium]|nr:serine acetyltransferase [Spirochaetales bacterium]
MESITKDVLESYREVGGINHLSGTSLPSRDSIKTLMITYESLIFPGFQSEELLESDYISFTVGNKLHQLASSLTIEIGKSLRFRCMQKGVVCEKDCRKEASSVARKILNKIPDLRKMALKDVNSALRGDPAARSHEEIILSYPGVEAITIHRFAHELYLLEIPLIPRMMSEQIHRKTGIDIHPGARIGENFFIDHGTGVVIGETSIIGDEVKVYQGVTIGALSVNKEDANVKRHPTIENGVTIYAGATILGGKTIIGEKTTIGGNVWITESVPPGSLVYNKPADNIIKNRDRKSS